jgi:Tol biopolymer transport system component
VLIICLLLGQVPGALEHDPRLSWYTLETEHFAVHFSCSDRLNEERARLAQELADICEYVYSIITPVTGWAPRTRVQVVVVDSYDEMNGWAVPFPDNTIVVIPSPPGASRSRDDDWLRSLVLHEYSHIVQMDQVHGIAAALRAVFGRVVLPNALAPAWLHEGYAIYNETRFSSGGRLRSTEYDMMARAAADAHRLLPVDRCGGYELQRYPGGNAPYLYGAWLYQYAAGTAGPDVWEEYNRSRSAGLPYCENWHARRVMGMSGHRLWKLTGQDLVRRAATARLGLGDTTRPERFTREGGWTSWPLWSRSGAEVYYVSGTGLEYPAIKAFDTTDKSTRALMRGRVRGNLTLSPDGRELAFSRTDLVGNYREASDLFALNLRHGTVRRLTRGERAKDPDFAPDTTLLVYVASHDGRSSLRILDLTSGASSVLTEPIDRTSFHGPRFSPSGRWIAVGVSRPGGATDIELVDRLTGWTVPVTDDRAVDLHPCWSRTGRYLFFVSDRSGVFNLYAYHVATGKTLRCSNVPYGAFTPAVSPDNRRIALTTYSADGYDVSVMPLDIRQWQEAEPFVDTLPEPWPETSPVSSQLYYYNPFPSIWPRFWLPWAQRRDEHWELGGFTLGWDALQFHRYWLATGARQKDWRPFFAVKYELRRYRPALSLAFDLDPQAQTGQLGAGFEFRQTTSGSWLDVAVHAARDSTLRGWFELGWLFSNAHTYRFNVAPTEGRICGLSADGRKRGLGSWHDRVRVIGYWTEYIGRPPGSWSLRGRLAAGFGYGDSSARSSVILASRSGLLAVRGYTLDTAGLVAVASGLQFRTPLAWVERGVGTGPVFLRNLNAAAFADCGMVCTRYRPRGVDLRRARIGVGAELRIDLLLGHFVPASFTSGIAIGLNPRWSYQSYLALNSGLVENLLGRSRRERWSALE